MTAAACLSWLQDFEQRHGFVPTALWVEQWLYRELLDLIPLRPAMYAEFTLTVNGIPVHPR